MFKYWSIKKFGTKLLPTLQKKFGVQLYYSASQVRSIVYKENFNPKYLPLGYILFLEDEDLVNIMAIEFPDINIASYKKEIVDFLENRRYSGYLKALIQ